MEEIKYVALRPLMFSNSPGSIPSTIRLSAGDLFSLDGDEGLDVGMLLSTGAIRVWHSGDAPVPQPPTTRARTRRRHG